MQERDHFSCGERLATWVGTIRREMTRREEKADFFSRSKIMRVPWSGAERRAWYMTPNLSFTGRERESSSVDNKWDGKN